MAEIKPAAKHAFHLVDKNVIQIPLKIKCALLTSNCKRTFTCY